MIENHAVQRVRDHLFYWRHVASMTREQRFGWWRSLIRLAQDEYDRELEELDSLNSLKADPSMALEIVE